MNSKKLKQEHPSVYAKFMAKNDVVFSMPYVFNMIGTFLHNYRGINIKQKVPLRLYVGIKKDFDAVDFDTITVYNHKTKVFEDVSSNSISYLESTLFKLKSAYNISGLKVSILSEIPKGYGLGFNYIVSALLEIVFSFCAGEIAIEDIMDNCSGEMNKVIDETKMGEILKSEKKLNQNLGRIGITTIAASFFNGDSPFLFFVRKEIRYDNKYYFYRFKELLHTNNKIYFSPLDISLIYGGVSSFMENFNLYYDDFYDWIGEGGKRLIQVLDDIGDTSPEGFNMFNRTLLSGTHAISEWYNNFLEIVGLEILHQFIGAVEGNSSEKQQAQLIAALNKVRLSNLLTKEVNENIKNILNKISEYLDPSMNDAALRTHDPIITGGSIMVSSKIDSMRDKIKQVSSLGYEGVVNFYNSFEDGWEKEGIVVEKNEPLKQENYIVLHGYTTGKKVVDYEQIKEETQKYDIVFDAINGKIIMNNKTLSSKEILSQQTTVELFFKLLTSNTGEISNKDLYKSSYRDNRSEMQSKIIKPFVQYCESVFGKDCILLELSGTANYYTISCTTRLSYAVIYKQI